MSEPHSPSVKSPVPIDVLNDLLALMRDGDRDAANDLIRAYSPLVALIVASRVRQLGVQFLSRIEADDAQEFWFNFVTKTVRTTRTFAAPGEFNAFLTAVIGNRIRDSQQYHTRKKRDCRLARLDVHVACANNVTSVRQVFA